MLSVDEWQAGPGRMLAEARGRRSYRSVAAIAGIDGNTWAMVERGGRTISGRFVRSEPTDQTLASVAVSVGLDPATVFAAADRPYRPDTLDQVLIPPPTAEALITAVDQLTELVVDLREWVQHRDDP